MENILKNKKYSGIFAAVIIASVFVGISLLVNNFIHGVPWFCFSGALRLIFGLLILITGKKLYGNSIKEIFSLDRGKVAIIAGLGFIVYFIYYLIDLSLGIKAITDLTLGVFISKIILQQITTGFYEELNYRYLILEGYFYGKKSVGNRLIYAFLSFILFGLVHVITGWDAYVFLQTGVIGFAFAVMYLKSRNIVVPMLFHFVYDIFANFASFVEWNDSLLFSSVNAVFEIVIVIMFILSLIMLIRKETLEITIGD